MKQAFLIARQEFIKYVTRRGFLLSILMFPLWIMIVVFVPRWTGESSGAPHFHTIAVVDRSGGGYMPTIAAALAHTPQWRVVAAPGYLTGVDDAHFAAAARSVLGSGAGDVPAAPPVDTIVVVPRDFGDGPSNTAQIWAEGRSDGDLHGAIENALTRALQLKAIHRYAPDLTDTSVLDASARLVARDPSHAAAHDNGMEAIVPIALAVILFVVSVMNSSVLLQGVVEEKSTRMIEVLLSCATPRQITTGKLIGVIAVALTTLLIWALVLFVLMALASRDTAAQVIGALEAVASLDTLPLLLVYFLCGLLIYGSLFLAIGSMAASLADAQSLLGPSMLILMLPNVMIGGVMHDPNGPFATALTFVPVYTPFFMMLRLTAHPPVWQLWAATALVLVTTAGMILWTGRIFARHVLTTERPPSLGALVKGLFGARA